MLSKTGIIFTAIVFYAMLGLCLSLDMTDEATVSAYEYQPNVTDSQGIEYSYSVFSFGNIVDNLVSLGWFNIVLFSPLAIIFGWVVVTSLIPTTNSGA